MADSEATLLEAVVQIVITIPGGDSHNKGTGMLVVSLRGVNEGLVRPRLFRTKQQYFLPCMFRLGSHVKKSKSLSCRVGGLDQSGMKMVSLRGVEKGLSHAQIDLF